MTRAALNFHSQTFPASQTEGLQLFCYFLPKPNNYCTAIFSSIKHCFKKELNPNAV